MSSAKQVITIREQVFKHFTDNYDTGYSIKKIASILSLDPRQVRRAVEFLMKNDTVVSVKDLWSGVGRVGTKSHVFALSHRAYRKVSKTKKRKELVMSIDRDYALANRSNVKLDEGEKRKLKEKLSEHNEPNIKSFWIEKIKEFTSLSSVKAKQLFGDLVLEKDLSFLRIYKGKAIYVHSTTPVWFHEKMPVVTMES